MTQTVPVRQVRLPEILKTTHNPQSWVGDPQFGLTARTTCDTSWQHTEPGFK